MQNLVKAFGKLFHRFEQIFARVRFSTVLIFLGVAVLGLSGGCAVFFTTRPESGAAESGTVLLSDDFSDPLSGWGVWNREDGTVSYDQGSLRITVNESQFDYWSVAGRTFSDVQVEVDAAKQSGPDDNDFGIICRYMDKSNFYLLVISSDGYYGIAKVRAGRYSMIGAEQLQYSDAIAQGSAQNHLRADCAGSSLRLYANGQLLMEAEDDDFSSGDVGLLAGAYNQQGVDILFDNFVVKKP